MSNRFDDKVVINTEAGSGLGQATALQVAKEGAKTSLVDLNSEGLEETKKAILETVPNAAVLLATADVSKEEDVKNYVNQTVEKFGEINGFRSEEHTSELQSRGHLVCRLLLEKKNIINTHI